MHLINWSRDSFYLARTAYRKVLAGYFDNPFAGQAVKGLDLIFLSYRLSDEKTAIEETCSHALLLFRNMDAKKASHHVRIVLVQFGVSDKALSNPGSLRKLFNDRKISSRVCHPKHRLHSCIC